MSGGESWKSMPGQPRVCAGCGKRIVLKREALWFKTMEPKATWHFRCRQNQRDPVES